MKNERVDRILELLGKRDENSRDQVERLIALLTHGAAEAEARLAHARVEWQYAETMPGDLDAPRGVDLLTVYGSMSDEHRRELTRLAVELALT